MFILIDISVYNGASNINSDGFFCIMFFLELA